MTGPGLVFPVLTLRHELGAIFGFPEAGRFGACGRDRLPLEPQVGDTIIDSHGVVWTIEALDGVGFGGSWADRLEQFLMRRRMAHYRLARGETLGIEDIKGRLLTEVGAIADLGIDVDAIKDRIRQAGTVDQLAEIFGFPLLPNESWLSRRGRATRSEFWTVTCVGLLWGALLFLILWDSPGAKVSLLPWLAFFGLAMPSGWALMATAARRFHDIGRSGAWIWLVFVEFRIGPLLVHFADWPRSRGDAVSGALVVLTWIALGLWPGDRQDNPHGPAPATAP